MQKTVQVEALGSRCVRQRLENKHLLRGLQRPTVEGGRLRLDCHGGVRLHWTVVTAASRSVVRGSNPTVCSWRPYGRRKRAVRAGREARHQAASPGSHGEGLIAEKASPSSQETRGPLFTRGCPHATPKPCEGTLRLHWRKTGPRR